MKQLIMKYNDMIRQLFIGLYAEGSTDMRFLESIVKRTFDDIAFECAGEFETYIAPIIINKTGSDFVEQVIGASKEGLEKFGISILCVHTDADSSDDRTAFNNKINPVLSALIEKDDIDFCKNITAIVPVQMIEAWMLADKEALKKEIGSDKSDYELGISLDPEKMSDPKIVIKNAIRISRSDLTKRRRHKLEISELYLPLGQKIELKKLDILPSFIKFKNSIRDSYRKLKFMS